MAGLHLLKYERVRLSPPAEAIARLRDGSRSATAWSGSTASRAARSAAGRRARPTCTGTPPARAAPRRRVGLVHPDFAPIGPAGLKADAPRASVRGVGPLPSVRAEQHPAAHALQLDDPVRGVAGLHGGAQPAPLDEAERHRARPLHRVAHAGRRNTSSLTLGAANNRRPGSPGPRVRGPPHPSAAPGRDGGAHRRRAGEQAGAGDRHRSGWWRRRWSGIAGPEPLPARERDEAGRPSWRAMQDPLWLAGLALAMAATGTHLRHPRGAARGGRRHRHRAGAVQRLPALRHPRSGPDEARGRHLARHHRADLHRLGAQAPRQGRHGHGPAALDLARPWRRAWCSARCSRCVCGARG